MKYYKAQPYNMEHTLCVCVEKYFLIQTAREISLTNGYNISNNDILIEISKQWGAETKDNFDKINDIDFRAIFRYKMYQKYNKSEIT